MELFQSCLSTVKIEEKQDLSFAKMGFLTLQESHGPLLRPITVTDSRFCLEKSTILALILQWVDGDSALRLENKKKKSWWFNSELLRTAC